MREHRLGIAVRRRIGHLHGGCAAVPGHILNLDAAGIAQVELFV